jgi:hypothetical protein
MTSVEEDPPGQGCSLQGTLSEASPGHGAPPCLIPEHSRVLVCVPPPHNLVQSDHDVHVIQLPSSAFSKRKLKALTASRAQVQDFFSSKANYEHQLSQQKIHFLFHSHSTPPHMLCMLTHSTWARWSHAHAVLRAVVSTILAAVRFLWVVACSCPCLNALGTGARAIAPRGPRAPGAINCNTPIKSIHTHSQPNMSILPMQATLAALPDEHSTDSCHVECEHSTRLSSSPIH